MTGIIIDLILIGGGVAITRAAVKLLDEDLNNFRSKKKKEK